MAFIWNVTKSLPHANASVLGIHMLSAMVEETCLWEVSRFREGHECGGSLRDWHSYESKAKLAIHPQARVAGWYTGATPRKWSSASLEEPHQEPSTLAQPWFFVLFQHCWRLESGSQTYLSKLSPASLVPWAQILNLPQLWATDRYCYLFYESHPIYDILLQKPELIKTGLNIAHSIHSML